MKNNIKQNVNDEEKKVSFEEAVLTVMEGINQRAIDMIACRFGFYGEEPMTLSQIGNKYGITRERVRQIIQEAINKVKQKAQRENLFKKAEEKVKFTVDEKYGIILKEELFKLLIRDDNEANFVNFILHCSEDLENKTDEKKLKEVVIVSGFDFARWNYVRSVVKKILEKQKEALKLNYLFEKFSERVNSEFEKEEFLNLLVVSGELDKNVFNRWGMSEWEEINPKSIRQKAYLVIREVGKPLHFREVADLIYRYKLSEKETHPQTVHNELIKDDKFVLVGRGTYALREWGYQQGTVKDVIENILKSSKTPVPQEKIIRKVLSIRNVKEATIIINLNNFFERKGARKYYLKNGE